MSAQPYHAFGPTWFAAHQRRLLGALNHPLLGRVLKRALRIRRCDLGYGLPIVAIRPQCYTVLRDQRQRTDGRWELTLTTDFRTHWKYSKRVYHAGKAVWWALHAWDQLVANPLVPAWHAGFDVLTVYPDPDPETTTVDGGLRRGQASATFSDLRDGTGTGQFPSTATGIFAGLDASTTTDEYTLMRKFVALFDTSPLTGGADVNSATVSLFAGSPGKSNGLGETPIHVALSSPTTDTNLVDADYQRVGRLSFGSIAYAAWTASVYNVFTLNATGLIAIATRGISKFSTQTDWDLNDNFTGTWASEAGSNYDGFYADQAGLANDPKLDVTYTIVTWQPPQSDSGGALIEVVPSGFGPPDFPEA